MLLQQNNVEPWQIILNIGFYVFLFVNIFYGQKLQFFIYSRQLESALIKIKDKRDETKALVKRRIIEYRKIVASQKHGEKSDVSAKELDDFLDEFLQFALIMPVDMDPSGIINKIDQLMDVRENRWDDAVLMLVPGLDSIRASNLENLIEAAMAVDQVYRIVRHFYIQGKKTKSLMFVMQMAMQIKIIEQMVKAYVKAANAFYYGQPIGDALGPQVAATLARIENPEGVKAREICKETTVQQVTINGRNIHIIRALGPGGTVGKPGQAIKMIVEELKGNVARIFMIDAAMKLEGEKTGDVIEGVGAAIGGIGVEKYKIEDASTGNKIPIDAYLCKQNLVDAITTMKKSISLSVQEIVERLKRSINERTKEGDNVIIAGIGNTIGIGI